MEYVLPVDKKIRVIRFFPRRKLNESVDYNVKLMIFGCLGKFIEITKIQVKLKIFKIIKKILIKKINFLYDLFIFKFW